MEVFKRDVAQLLRKEIADDEGLSTKEIGALLELPDQLGHGDIAFPCFALAKKRKKAPPKIAAEIAKQLSTIESANIERIVAVGGYVNFFVRPERLAKEVLSAIHNDGEKYGGIDIGQLRTIVVEFSSPNIAKPFGIGHLRSTNIGAALSRIYQFLNYKVVRINHLGDWGTQFGKIITAYKRWGKADFLKGDPIMNLYQLYVKFHEEEENQPELADEARDWFSKLERGEDEARELWEWFRELTLTELKGIYSIFGIQFDHITGESFYSDKMAATVKKLEDLKLLELSEGAKIVRLEQENLTPAIIKKSDDATLYLTRDLSAAEYRFKTFNFDEQLYVVGNPQELHFKQLFAVLKKMNYDWAARCKHIGFGHLTFKEGKGMSTRKGNIVFLKDVLDKAKSMSATIIQEKRPDMKDHDHVSMQVAIAALIYADFSARRHKDVKFSWQDILNFDGETGPYLQYTSVRVRSLLDKFTGSVTSNVDFCQLSEVEEQALIKHLSLFSSVLVRTSEENEPFVLASYTMDLAKRYNKFYTKHRVLDQDGETSLARILLTRSTSTVLDTALTLLGIPLPEKM
jgi:arginyl-tRNA synthetase